MDTFGKVLNNLEKHWYPQRNKYPQRHFFTSEDCLTWSSVYFKGSAWHFRGRVDFRCQALLPKRCKLNDNSNIFLKNRSLNLFDKMSTKIITICKNSLKINNRSFTTNQRMLRMNTIIKKGWRKKNV